MEGPRENPRIWRPVWGLTGCSDVHGNRDTGSVWYRLVESRYRTGWTIWWVGAAYQGRVGFNGDGWVNVGLFVSIVVGRIVW